MAKHTIVLIPGDGIGPEVTAATVRVLEASGAPLEWESHVVGAEAVGTYGVPLPQPWNAPASDGDAKRAVLGSPPGMRIILQPWRSTRSFSSPATASGLR